MASEHITAGEFERFAKRLFEQLDAIEAQCKATNGRVTTLETEQKITKRIAAYISAAVGTIIALAGLAIAWLKG